MFDSNNDHVIYPDELSQKLVEKGISGETEKHKIFFDFMDTVTYLLLRILKCESDRIMMDECHGWIGIMGFEASLKE